MNIVIVSGRIYLSVAETMISKMINFEASMRVFRTTYVIKIAAINLLVTKSSTPNATHTG